MSDPRPEDQAASEREPAARAGAEEPAAEEPFADLDQRPVAEHVAVFEAEHDRLRRQLGTIDQL